MGVNDRHCYLSEMRLAAVLDAPKALDAILGHLGVPLKSGVRRNLSDDQKVDEIVAHTRHLIVGKNSPWRHCSGFEVLAAAVWQLRGDGLGAKLVDHAFCSVRNEADLTKPVAAWLSSQDLDVYDEVPMGRKRTDLLGHRPKKLLRGHRFIAIELKNSIKEFDRAIDQMTTYADYTHEVYVACTPAMAVAYLDAHSNGRGTSGWDPQVLNRKLEKLGLGLLLVEGEEVCVLRRPRQQTPLNKNVDEVLAALKTR
jgi:hypothetical protein